MGRGRLSCRILVIPFPRELSEMLTREMIHVFDIDVCVLFNPGSGRSLLATIIENRRAVAIVKNKEHKEFVMKNLSEQVRALNLAADKRPPKPQELSTWESTHGTGARANLPLPAGGALAAAGGAPPSGAPPRGNAPVLPPAMVPAPSGLPMPVVPPLSVPSPAAPASAPSPGSGLAAFGAAVLR